MNDPLEPIRCQCRSIADAVRWACVLEATAPKVGNVHPSKSFSDLCYADFVLAGGHAADAFATHPGCFSRAVELAASRIAESIGTNVNLGILLLLGPLVQSEDEQPSVRADSEAWISAVAESIQRLASDDAARLYSAINIAQPGGMGEVESMDLRRETPESFLQAMQAAKERDRIARNYCEGFRDLFENVVPIVRASVNRSGCLLSGIAKAHLELLSLNKDTLIARKFGDEVAHDVQRRAGEALGDRDRIATFDEFLRGEGGETNQRLNPGTTADLIAAALYVLLRQK